MKNGIMKKTEIPIPAIAAIAATRGMLGAGIGLLLAPQISSERRRAVGWTLVGIGLASTIPLAALVFRGYRRSATATPATPVT